MKYSKTNSVIVSVVFLALILILGIVNFKDIYTNIKEAISDSSSAEELQKNLAQVETKAKSDFVPHGLAVDIYGLSHMVMNNNIIGNNEFYKCENGQIVRFNSSVSTTEFQRNIRELSEVLSDKGIPLVYVQIPYLANTDAEKEFTGYDQYMDAMQEMMSSFPETVDVLDLNKVLGEDILRDFYFKTDIHPTTNSGFASAQAICSFLFAQYGLDFGSMGTVFDKENYTCSAYPFVGNTAKNSGRYFSSTDSFEVYEPDFETSMDMYIYDNNKERSGSFSDVCLNGYENNADLSGSTYWVTDFLQYPQSHYEINNRLCSGPRLLYITDSYFLSCMAYTTLAASKVTVVDPRFLDDKYLLASLLDTEEYDAVIVGGASPAYLSAQFRSVFSLPEQVEPFQNMSHGGMFLKVNGDKPEDQKIIPESMFLSDDTVTFTGWAVDQLAGKPLSALYLKLGDRMLKCSYGSSMPAVASLFKNDDLNDTGFSVTFPTEYLDGLDHFEFIQVGNDASYVFQNVRYFIPRENKVYDPDSVSLPEEVKPLQQSGYYGMWLDTVNGVKPENKGEIKRSMYGGSQTVTLSGWATDFAAGMPLAALYLKAGDRLIECGYGISMSGLASVFENYDLLNSGFTVTFPAEYLDNVDKLEFIQVGSDGTYRYQNVGFLLTD